jgi:hypothetical protein
VFLRYFLSFEHRHESTPPSSRNRLRVHAANATCLTEGIEASAIEPLHFQGFRNHTNSEFTLLGRTIRVTQRECGDP